MVHCTSLRAETKAVLTAFWNIVIETTWIFIFLLCKTLKVRNVQAVGSLNFIYHDDSSAGLSIWSVFHNTQCWILSVTPVVDPLVQFPQSGLVSLEKQDQGHEISDSEVITLLLLNSVQLKFNYWTSKEAGIICLLRRWKLKSRIVNNKQSVPNT